MLSFNENDSGIIITLVSVSRPSTPEICSKETAKKSYEDVTSELCTEETDKKSDKDTISDEYMSYETGS